MYKRLPKELIIHIFSFDSTYRYLYNQCIQELQYIYGNSDMLNIFYGALIVVTMLHTIKSLSNSRYENYSVVAHVYNRDDISDSNMFQ